MSYDDGMGVLPEDEQRRLAMKMRGTPVAVLVPNDDLGNALYRWALEVTRLVEGL